MHIFRSFFERRQAVNQFSITFEKLESGEIAVRVKIANKRGQVFYFAKEKFYKMLEQIIKTAHRFAIHVEKEDSSLIRDVTGGGQYWNCN